MAFLTFLIGVFVGVGASFNGYLITRIFSTDDDKPIDWDGAQ